MDEVRESRVDEVRESRVPIPKNQIRTANGETEHMHERWPKTHS